MGDNIHIFFNGVEIKDSPITVTASSFSIDFNIPEDALPGTAYITVKDKDGNQLGAIRSFTIWEAEIKLDTEMGTVGTMVTIEGRGFYAGKRVTLFYYNGSKKILDIESATPRGECSYSFQIPESTAGKLTILAQDALGNSARASFEVISSTTIKPAAGIAGDKVTVSGSGFGYKSDITIYLENIEVAIDRTDKDGSFETTFAVPQIAVGTYDVEVEDEDDNKDEAKFTIGVGAILSQTIGNIGTEITISGTGFIAGGAVTIKYDALATATATADSNGTFSATFKVPVSQHGDHSITVSDGTNTKTYTFTVESTPPPAPPLLLPEDISKAEAEIHFDWDDIDDPSQPVTYTFQIASDKDFTTIVLEEKDLTESEYTITEEEKLEPAKEEAPYYWRVKAIDGAANEGEWSTPSSFYVGFAFEMPGWAIYTLIGFGVLLLGFVLFWLGRRTAYY